MQAHQIEFSQEKLMYELHGASFSFGIAVTKIHYLSLDIFIAHQSRIKMHKSSSTQTRLKYATCLQN